MDTQADRLWRDYWADRTDARRNALSDHYTAWTSQTAQRIALRFGLRDVEAATQEALLKVAVVVIPSYDGRVSFKGWAAIAIRRHLIDLARKQASRPEIVGYNADQQADPFSVVDMSEAIRAALRRLTPAQKSCFLRRAAGATLQEVADSCGHSTRWVRGVYTKAVCRLRLLLSDL